MKKYDEWTKNELIDHVKELNGVIDQMREIIEAKEIKDLPWAGNLGHWHWAIKTDHLIFNKLKATNLGYEESEIPENVGIDFFISKLHPDDYDYVMQNMQDHIDGKTDAYNVEYRIQKKDGTYTWYYDRGIIEERDADNQPILISGIVFDINHNKKLEKRLKASNERLTYLAMTDSLTNLYNRRFIIDKLEMFVSNKIIKDFSLIMLDVDDFKKINDNYGHLLGDEVLIKIAKILKKEVSELGFSARWGGEEFLIVLPNIDKEQAVNIANSIKIKLEETQVNSTTKITASFGVHEYDCNKTVDDNLKIVDNLMYQSKWNGKNCISCE